MNDDTEIHLYQYGVVPIRLEGTVNDKRRYIWSNTSPNSPQFVRPYCIARKQETDSELTKTVI